MTTKPPPSPKTPLVSQMDKRRKSDNLVLIQSIKNDLRRILAKRNSLSLTDLNDSDIPAEYADILLLGADVDSATLLAAHHNIVGGKYKTARSLSTIPSSSATSSQQNQVVGAKWLKKISSKATMAIKKSFENIFFGYMIFFCKL